MRNFLILLFLSIGINIEGQTVSYTYRPLAAEGCQMKYSVIKQSLGQNSHWRMGHTQAPVPMTRLTITDRYS